MYKHGTLEITDLSQVIGSILNPLDDILDNSNIVFNLVNLVYDQPAVWVGTKLPGQSTEVLLLLL